MPTTIRVYRTRSKKFPIRFEIFKDSPNSFYSELGRAGFNQKIKYYLMGRGSGRGAIVFKGEKVVNNERISKIPLRKLWRYNRRFKSGLRKGRKITPKDIAAWMIGKAIRFAGINSFNLRHTSSGLTQDLKLKYKKRRKQKYERKIKVIF